MSRVEMVGWAALFLAVCYGLCFLFFGGAGRVEEWDETAARDLDPGRARSTMAGPASGRGSNEDAR